VSLAWCLPCLQSEVVDRKCTKRTTRTCHFQINQLPARNGLNEQRWINLNRAGMALICRDASYNTGSLPVRDLWHSREWLGILHWTATHCFGERIQ
jgi:hypothetical protein